MKYLVVSLLDGDIVDFHKNLVTEVCSTFNVKAQKIGAHFTIKAPFERDYIEDIEKLTEEFCGINKSMPYPIDNYGYFRKNVIYMNIIGNETMASICESYLNRLKDLDNIEWKRNEGGKKVFHCTVVSKIPEFKFDDIKNFVNMRPCKFQCNFNNITIMKWMDYKWVVHKRYELK